MTSVASNRIEAATIRKLRIRLLPFLFALYVFAFIDRINLGFAALTMNRELAITSQQFGFAAGIFFWGYFLLEVPFARSTNRVRELLMLRCQADSSPSQF
jgi:MFS transporter, ACS family, tartrate transporter